MNKRDEMKGTLKVILIEHRRGDTNTEDASEAVMKVLEKALAESIEAAVKRIPGIGKLLGGVK